VIVLCATNGDVERAMTQLRRMRVRSYKRGAGQPEVGVEVSTVHKAKGFGFDTVVVMRLRKNSVKLAATAVSRARTLLYVHSSLCSEYGIKTASHVRRFGELSELREFFTR